MEGKELSRNYTPKWTNHLPSVKNIASTSLFISSNSHISINIVPRLKRSWTDMTRTLNGNLRMNVNTTQETQNEWMNAKNITQPIWLQSLWSYEWTPIFYTRHMYKNYEPQVREHIFPICMKNHCKGFGWSSSSNDDLGMGNSGGRCRWKASTAAATPSSFSINLAISIAWDFTWEDIHI